MLLSEIFRHRQNVAASACTILLWATPSARNYGEARRYNDLLMDKSQRTFQASGHLRTMIDNKVAKEGLMGVAIIKAASLLRRA